MFVDSLFSYSSFVMQQAGTARIGPIGGQISRGSHPTTTVQKSVRETVRTAVGAVQS